MTTEGPGPDGPGPSPSAEEAARRRVYRPGATEQDRAEYERLEAAARVAEAQRAARPREDVASGEEVAEPPASRLPRRAIVIGASVIVAALIVIVGIPRGTPPLPDHVGIPYVSGTTLTILSRDSDPRTKPGAITYQPQGYTVFQPGRRVLHAVIRCQGAGTVVIAVGAVFRFRCTSAEAVLRQSADSTGRPFVAVGTTHGNVVWSARVTVD